MIDPENPVESASRSAIFRAVWLNFTIFSGLLLTASMSLMHLADLGVIPLSMPFALYLLLGVSLLIVVWAFILAFRYGQGGSRINRGRKKGTVLNACDDDRHWKAGIFYFNREDPSLFVEKRFGVGFTFNLARPVIWAVVAGIAALCIWITAIANGGS